MVELYLCVFQGICEQVEKGEEVGLGTAALPQAGGQRCAEVGR